MPSPPIGGAEDDLLYIMYTSGTTGLPKGAVHTHNTATWGVLTINSTADLRIGDRYLVSLPLFHVGALTPITSNVHRGVTSVVMRSFDAARSWQLIESESITVGLKVPSMLNFMLQVHDPAKHPHGQLRWIMSGAAPVPVSLIEAYAGLGIEIHQVYGLTETCGPACVISAADALRKAGSTGKAFFHTDVRVVDDAGRDVAPGDAGEVLVRGKHIMKAYWNRPEATAETIVDGWLKSGDVATVDAEGFVYIQDRIKDMIISGGENVYPAEVESVLMRHPQIVEAAVIGQPSEKWGESAVAIVVPKGDGLDPSVGALVLQGQAGAVQTAGERLLHRADPAQSVGKDPQADPAREVPGPGAAVARSSFACSPLLAWPPASTRPGCRSRCSRSCPRSSGC